MAKSRQIIRPVLEEFQVHKCGFEHMLPHDFVKSQWQNRTKSVFYLLYRWAISLFFIGAVTTSMVGLGVGGLWFIYLTNWGILLCMFTSLLGAILVSLWHFHPEYAEKVTDSNSMPVTFKIYWGMHNTSLILSMVISIVYWAVLHNDNIPLNASNVLTHACNSIIMFLDLWVVAYPIRLLHIFLPVSLGVLYIIFSVIYYLAGGVDINGQPYIYPVLNWNTPGHASLTAFGVLVLACFLYIFIFYIYKLRVFIYTRCRKQEMVLPTTTSRRASSTATVPSTGISMVLGNYGHDNRAFTGSSVKISS